MLSNQTSRVYCDEYELDGLLTAIRQKFEQAQDETEAAYWSGMNHAVWLLRTAKLRDQSEFFVVLKNMEIGRIYYTKGNEDA